MAGYTGGRASICQSSRFRNNQRGKLVSDLGPFLAGSLARCVTRSTARGSGGRVFNYDDSWPMPRDVIRLPFYQQQSRGLR